MVFSFCARKVLEISVKFALIKSGICEQTNMIHPCDTINGRPHMNSIYKVVEIIGTSDKSWEDASRNAIEMASKTLKELRVAEVKEMDISVDNGKLTYRIKLRLSFKFVD
jgi:dodecin